MVDFVSVRLGLQLPSLWHCFLTLLSVALYGLLLFYSLAREDLRGRRPLAKFLAIKMLVFLTFYQGFMVSSTSKKSTERFFTSCKFDALENHVIHGR